jgi:hypothetical protein
VLLLFNAWHESVAVSLPAHPQPHGLWLKLLDTAEPDAPAHTLPGEAQVAVGGRTFVLLASQE